MECALFGIDRRDSRVVVVRTWCEACQFEDAKAVEGRGIEWHGFEISQ